MKRSTATLLTLHALQCLTKIEQRSLGDVLREARKQGTTLADEAWPSKRSKREQRAVRKIRTEFDRLKLIVEAA
jgi:hypothetical protein